MDNIPLSDSVESPSEETTPTKVRMRETALRRWKNTINRRAKDLGFSFKRRFVACRDWIPIFGYRRVPLFLVMTGIGINFPCGLSSFYVSFSMLAARALQHHFLDTMSINYDRVFYGISAGLWNILIVHASTNNMEKYFLTAMFSSILGALALVTKNTNNEMYFQYGHLFNQIDKKAGFFVYDFMAILWWTNFISLITLAYDPHKMIMLGDSVLMSGLLIAVAEEALDYKPMLITFATYSLMLKSEGDDFIIKIASAFGIGAAYMGFVRFSDWCCRGRHPSIPMYKKDERKLNVLHFVCDRDSMYFYEDSKLSDMKPATDMAKMYARKIEQGEFMVFAGGKPPERNETLQEFLERNSLRGVAFTILAKGNGGGATMSVEGEDEELFAAAGAKIGKRPSRPDESFSKDPFHDYLSTDSVFSSKPIMSKKVIKEDVDGDGVTDKVNRRWVKREDDGFIHPAPGQTQAFRYEDETNQEKEEEEEEEDLSDDLGFEPSGRQNQSEEEEETEEEEESEEEEEEEEEAEEVENSKKHLSEDESYRPSLDDVPEEEKQTEASGDPPTYQEAMEMSQDTDEEEKEDEAIISREELRRIMWWKEVVNFNVSSLRDKTYLPYKKTDYKYVQDNGHYATLTNEYLGLLFTYDQMNEFNVKMIRYILDCMKYKNDESFYDMVWKGRMYYASKYSLRKSERQYNIDNMRVGPRLIPPPGFTEKIVRQDEDKSGVIVGYMAPTGSTGYFRIRYRSGNHMRLVGIEKTCALSAPVLEREVTFNVKMANLLRKGGARCTWNGYQVPRYEILEQFQQKKNIPEAVPIEFFIKGKGGGKDDDVKGNRPDPAKKVLCHCYFKMLNPNAPDTYNPVFIEETVEEDALIPIPKEVAKAAIRNNRKWNHAMEGNLETECFKIKYYNSEQLKHMYVDKIACPGQITFSPVSETDETMAAAIEDNKVSVWLQNHLLERFTPFEEQYKRFGIDHSVSMKVKPRGIGGAAVDPVMDMQEEAEEEEMLNDRLELDLNVLNIRRNEIGFMGKPDEEEYKLNSFGTLKKFYRNGDYQLSDEEKKDLVHEVDEICEKIGDIKLPDEETPEEEITTYEEAIEAIKDMPANFRANDSMNTIFMRFVDSLEKFYDRNPDLEKGKRDLIYRIFRFYKFESEMDYEHYEIYRKLQSITNEIFCLMTPADGEEIGTQPVSAYFSLLECIIAMERNYEFWIHTAPFWMRIHSLAYKLKAICEEFFKISPTEINRKRTVMVNFVSKENNEERVLAPIWFEIEYTRDHLIQIQEFFGSLDIDHSECAHIGKLVKRKDEDLRVTEIVTLPVASDFVVPNDKRIFVCEDFHLQIDLTEEAIFSHTDEGPHPRIYIMRCELAQESKKEEIEKTASKDDEGDDVEEDTNMAEDGDDAIPYVDPHFFHSEISVNSEANDVFDSIEDHLDVSEELPDQQDVEETHDVDQSVVENNPTENDLTDVTDQSSDELEDSQDESELETSFSRLKEDILASITHKNAFRMLRGKILQKQYSAITYDDPKELLEYITDKLINPLDVSQLSAILNYSYLGQTLTIVRKYADENHALFEEPPEMKGDESVSDDEPDFWALNKVNDSVYKNPDKGRARRNKKTLQYEGYVKCAKHLYNRTIREQTVGGLNRMLTLANWALQLGEEYKCENKMLLDMYKMKADLCMRLFRFEEAVEVIGQATTVANNIHTGCSQDSFDTKVLEIECTDLCIKYRYQRAANAKDPVEMLEVVNQVHYNVSNIESCAHLLKFGHATLDSEKGQQLVDFALQYSQVIPKSSVLYSINRYLEGAYEEKVKTNKIKRRKEGFASHARFLDLKRMLRIQEVPVVMTLAPQQFEDADDEFSQLDSDDQAERLENMDLTKVKERFQSVKPFAFDPTFLGWKVKSFEEMLDFNEEELVWPKEETMPTVFDKDLIEAAHEVTLATRTNSVFPLMIERYYNSDSLKDRSFGKKLDKRHIASLQNEVEELKLKVKKLRDDEANNMIVGVEDVIDTGRISTSLLDWLRRLDTEQDQTSDWRDQVYVTIKNRQSYSVKEVQGAMAKIVKNVLDSQCVVASSGGGGENKLPRMMMRQLIKEKAELQLKVNDLEYELDVACKVASEFVYVHEVRDKETENLLVEFCDTPISLNELKSTKSMAQYLGMLHRKCKMTEEIEKTLKAMKGIIDKQKQTKEKAAEAGFTDPVIVSEGYLESLRSQVDELRIELQMCKEEKSLIELKAREQIDQMGYQHEEYRRNIRDEIDNSRRQNGEEMEHLRSEMNHFKEEHLSLIRENEELKRQQSAAADEFHSRVKIAIAERDQAHQQANLEMKKKQTKYERDLLDEISELRVAVARHETTVCKERESAMKYRVSILEDVSQYKDALAALAKNTDALLKLPNATGDGSIAEEVTASNRMISEVLKLMGQQVSRSNEEVIYRENQALVRRITELEIQLKPIQPELFIDPLQSLVGAIFDKIGEGDCREVMEAMPGFDTEKYDEVQIFTWLFIRATKPFLNSLFYDHLKKEMIASYVVQEEYNPISSYFEDDEDDDEEEGEGDEERAEGGQDDVGDEEERRPKSKVQQSQNVFEQMEGATANPEQLRKTRDDLLVEHAKLKAEVAAKKKSRAEDKFAEYRSLQRKNDDTLKDTNTHTSAYKIFFKKYDKRIAKFRSKESGEDEKVRHRMLEIILKGDVDVVSQYEQNIHTTGDLDISVYTDLLNMQFKASYGEYEYILMNIFPFGTISPRSIEDLSFETISKSWPGAESSEGRNVTIKNLKDRDVKTLNSRYRSESALLGSLPEGKHTQV